MEKKHVPLSSEEINEIREERELHYRESSVANIKRDFPNAMDAEQAISAIRKGKKLLHADMSRGDPENYIYYDRKTRRLRHSDGKECIIPLISCDYLGYSKDYYDWEDYFWQKWFYEFGWILFNHKNVEKLKKLEEGKTEILT